MYGNLSEDPNRRKEKEVIIMVDDFMVYEKGKDLVIEANRTGIDDIRRYGRMRVGTRIDGKITKVSVYLGKDYETVSAQRFSEAITITLPEQIVVPSAQGKFRFTYPKTSIHEVAV